MNKAEYEKCTDWVYKVLGFTAEKSIYQHTPKSMIISFHYQGLNWKLYRMKGTRKTALLRNDDTCEWIEVKSFKDFRIKFPAWIKRITKTEGLRYSLW